MSIVTVITPSIGRTTLKEALESLQNQSNPKWLSLVGFDGVNPPQPVQDNRITYVYLTKVGGGFNHGGRVRNKLIPLVVTDWLCFLDDDDSFRPHYVDALAAELTANPDADCIIFRMSYDDKDSKVLPPSHLKNIQACLVGISCAVRKEFLVKNGIEFKNGPMEDYYFLKKIEDNRGKIVFSKEITYNVR